MTRIRRNEGTEGSNLPAVGEYWGVETRTQDKCMVRKKSYVDELENRILTLQPLLVPQHDSVAIVYLSYRKLHQ